MRNGESRASANKRIRQEALRNQLANQKLVEKVLDNIKKIEELESGSETFQNDLAKYRTSNEQRLKLINKYLPDVKAVELSGPEGDPIEVRHAAELTDEQLEKLIANKG